MFLDNLWVHGIFMPDAENNLFTEFFAIVDAADNQLKRVRWPVPFFTPSYLAFRMAVTRSITLFARVMPAVATAK